MTDLTSESLVYDATSPHEASDLMAILSLDNLLGRIFLLPAQESGEQKQACIIKHDTHLDDSEVAHEDQLCLYIKIHNQDDFQELILIINSWTSRTKFRTGRVS